MDPTEYGRILPAPLAKIMDAAHRPWYESAPPAEAPKPRTRIVYETRPSPTSGDVSLAIQPLVAFKRLYDYGNGILQSPMYPMAWTPGEPVQAICAYGFMHDAGEKDCTCGIHAVHAGSHYLTDVNCHTAIVAVYLWGQVSERTDGYRAQYADIAGIFYNDEFNGNLKKYKDLGIPMVEVQGHIVNAQQYEDMKKTAYERFYDGSWKARSVAPDRTPVPGYTELNYARSSSLSRDAGRRVLSTQSFSVQVSGGGIKGAEEAVGRMLNSGQVWMPFSADTADVVVGAYTLKYKRGADRVWQLVSA